MGGLECERVDMKWLALCTDGSTGRDQERLISRAVIRQHQLKRTVPPRNGTLFRLSKKRQSHFFEKASLRSAPLLSADSGQFDAHSAQSVFCHAHVAAENGSYCFRVCGRETLRGFF